jgi:uncharacterized phiE125 gp8 family phage protein
MYREPVLVTAPAEEPLTLAEAKLHAQIEYTNEDTLVTRWIETSRRHVEGRTGRALITSTWDLWLDRFPCEYEIRLPKGKLQSVTYIKYYDTANAEYTVSSSTYHVATKREPGAVVLAYGQSWPSATLRTAEAVVIRFVCGFGDADDVPAGAKQAMCLLIKHFADNRGEVVIGNNASAETKRIEMGVESLLACSDAYPLHL